MNISFIGLGIMGFPIAKNLYTGGNLQKVYNRTKEKADFYKETSVQIVNTPLEASEGADIIFVMVSDSQDAEEVILGEKGVIDGAKKGSIVVDMSSINPEVSKKIARKLKQQEINMVDAPVSGGEQGAIDKKLAIMVGGEKTDVSTIMPYLEQVGKNITHVGPLGSGGYAKLANQIIVAMGLQSIAEAFYLAKQSNLDFNVLYNAINSGLAGSNVLDQKIGNLSNEKFQPGFKINLHLKDLNNALQVAQEKNINLPLTKEIQHFMEDMNQSGLGDLDHSSLYKYISE